MMNSELSSDLFVKTSTIEGAGFGVFAGRDFRAGEVIEVCPVTFIPLTALGIVVMYLFRRHLYYFGENDESRVIAQGCGRFYNQGIPNAAYEKMIEQRVIIFRALEDIRKGNEIVVDYRHGKIDDTEQLLEYGIFTS